MAEKNPYIPERPDSVLSEGGGMGEEGMMSFFRGHMECILRPFAENVEELYKTVSNISSNINVHQAQTELNTGVLQDHGDRLDLIQRNQKDLMQAAEATRQMLQGTIDQSGKAEQARSLRIEKLDETLSTMQRQIADLQKNSEETRTKMAVLQDVGDKNTNANLRVKNELENVAKNLERTDKEHATTIQTMNSNKLLLDTHIKEQEQLAQQHKEQRDKHDILDKHCETRFDTVVQQITDVQKLLCRYQLELQQDNESTKKLLTTRLDKQDAWNVETLAKLSKTNLEMSSQQARMSESSLRTDEILRMREQKQTEQMRDVHRILGELNALASKHTSEVSELQTATGVLAGRAQTRIEFLEEEADLSYMRNLRVERVFNLETMTKENAKSIVEPDVHMMRGSLVTDGQLNKFEEAFKSYDKDGSGSVNGREIGNILEGMGIEVDNMVIQLVMKEFDNDGSGEVNSAEFCEMMAKMIGPDGEVDVERYMKNISETALREARQNEIVELFPKVQDEVKKHQSLIETEQSRLHGTNNRLQNLEGYHADLLKEVQQLRKDLDLNNASWKGMTRGLKETKKIVHTEGDGEMLQGTMTLRRALPPLASTVPPMGGRPGSRGDCKSDGLAQTLPKYTPRTNSFGENRVAGG